ncbi:MAG: bifunctional enoyl-CoA hydratase/phosphate acetyltransferase [Eubacterium sp.]|nr:bifunctional enoyl-CoA hydratase/phosphate acetyltransferase [Eubacterium sp.]
MVLKNFDILVEKVKSFPEPMKVVVAAAGDEHTLEAVKEGMDEGIVKPVLVGDKAKIDDISAKIGLVVDEADIYDVPDADEAAQKTVQLIHEGKGDFILKGNIDTSRLLKPVVNKETGLGTGRVMSHFVFDELPYYHKLLVTTDGGMMTYPTLEQKKQIIENTVDVLKKLGYECPKIACVAAVEKVNPKMPETVEADALKQMYLNGEIKDCIIEGPISLDLAIDAESAKIKGFESPVAGDADVILVPNIQVGNVLGKAITFIAKGNMAGFVVGSKVPVVFTSRGSTAKEKFLSLVLAAAVSAGKTE